jgi:8-oxo-dGTP pyrophosphatase MutT (NUDIX family)
MHRLQQEILSRLIHSDDLRYADIKPPEVEGNLFMYHLRQLMAQNLVEKLPNGRYCLSADGKTYADSLSLKTFQPRIQPRIVTLMACRDTEGRWLMFRRKRQPLLGMVGFPYGKIHLGETVLQAAERELKEKTGLSAFLLHRGDGYVTISSNGKPVSQVMFHLFQGKGVTGELKDSGSGEAFWADLAEIDQSELIPSVSDLIRQVESTPIERRFFVELSYELR